MHTTVCDFAPLYVQFDFLVKSLSSLYAQHILLPVSKSWGEGEGGGGGEGWGETCILLA